ncbi:MAG: hypothetical protein PHS93_07550, partial [Candidatus Omnitrophica bacterium]|nr:hypothetical protein [Candidatus Omnitrophota bacterium]
MQPSIFRHNDIAFANQGCFKQRYAVTACLKYARGNAYCLACGKRGQEDGIFALGLDDKTSP